MQTLYVKERDKTTKTVHVHRSWQDINGRHIFLHHTGVYGYKNGDPVRTRQELEGLPTDHQRLAIAWWNRVGQAMANEFYGQKEAAAAQNAGDFQEQIAAEESNTQLDSILYARRTIGKRGKPTGAVTAPKPWMEYGFTKRPDWWGQARGIAFPDYVYEMLDAEVETPDTQKESAKTEAGGDPEQAAASAENAPEA